MKDILALTFGATGKRLLSTLFAVVVMMSAASADEALDSGIQGVELIWDAGKYRAVSELWEQTDEFWHEGDFENAIRVLLKIIEVDPTQTEAYENAGWLLDSTDHIFEGFDMLVQNVLTNPRDCDAHFELAMKYYYMGGFDIAVGKLETSRIWDCSNRTERMLAHAYEKAGDKEKAVWTFACLLGRDPNDGAALLNLMRLLRNIPSKHDPTRLWHRPDPQPVE